MASGEIPVSGSAVVGGTFPINPRKNKPGDDDLIVRVPDDKQLHIFVNNGAGKVFNEDLEPGWRFEIRAR